ncbi:DUF389 domain-containing protein [Mucilaginibacter sp. R11]|uniref:DUF389 domain-containing protein n=2 Tax=Mucilaginibacter agri TaxID=2695265 RepID=A0A965ZHZ1_9SPHI|nr:DUF389 domain-containing protein [Mucilaginibacter agri]
MGKILANIKKFLSFRFNLQEGRATDAEIKDSIVSNVVFKGVNLWALIFAIFIASIGLNVNSTAVIIGAMLISPIMGPIMGVGLGIGINDLDLVKRGLMNLLVATLIGIITSTIYFSVTPLHEAQSELLARTLPSVWDVFIAFFGGAAGMVAASRKEKSNVIPGVAIATALMPPLCTAGFGIATGNWYYVLGALYLYFINSVFIAIATFVISRYIKMRKKHLADAGQEKKVNRYIIIIVVITILPSILMAYRIADRSIFETNARRFVEEEFKFKNTQVISKAFHYNLKRIDLLLIGKDLKPEKIDSLSKDLANYNLKGIKLNIRQGLDAGEHIDISQIKASILDEVYATQFKGDTVTDTIVRTTSPSKLSKDTAVFNELKVLYPTIQSFGINQTVVYHTDKTKADTVKLVLATFKTPIADADRKRMQAWLSVRYKAPKLRLLIDGK